MTVGGIFYTKRLVVIQQLGRDCVYNTQHLLRQLSPVYDLALLA